MKFFEFRQSNAGGSFAIDDAAGIGPRVWIQAINATDAINKAKAVGLYFDSVGNYEDCPCCGYRWFSVNDCEAEEYVDLCPYDFLWHDTVYLHRADGEIVRFSRADCGRPLER